MSCQTDIPIKDIADIVGEDFIAKEGGKGTDTTLIDPRIRGDVALDKDAKEALCYALNPCIDEALTPLENEINEVDKKADDAASAAQDANNAADNAMSEAQAAGEAANAATEAAQSAQQTALNKAVAQVIAEDDKRTIVLQDGTKIPFYVTDKVVSVEPLYQDEKVVGFGVKGDNVVITMIDGTEHDLTRQEFADWLAAQDTPLATDNELAEAIAQGTGVLQEQIDTVNQGLDSLQAQIDAFDTDQAMLFARGGNLVLRNEDGTEHEVPLTSLIPISSDSGNLLTMRENGIYYGIEAEPNLAKLYVDSEYGDDSTDIEDGGGTKQKPFKTLGRALRLVPSDNSSTVYVKSVDANNQPLIYIVDRDYKLYRGATRRIVPYGEQPNIPSEISDCITSKSYFFDPSAANQFIKPILRFNWKKYRLKPNDYQQPYRLGGDDNSKWHISSMDVELTRAQHDKSVYTPRNTEIMGGVNVAFSNCSIIDFGNDNECGFYIAAGKTSNVALTGTDFVNPRTRGKYMDIYTGSLGITCRNNDGIAFSQYLSECDPEGVLTRKADNSSQILSRSGAITGVVRHPSGVPLNVTANFNI